MMSVLGGIIISWLHVFVFDDLRLLKHIQSGINFFYEKEKLNCREKTRETHIGGVIWFMKKVKT